MTIWYLSYTPAEKASFLSHVCTQQRPIETRLRTQKCRAAGKIHTAFNCYKGRVNGSQGAIWAVCAVLFRKAGLDSNLNLLIWLVSPPPAVEWQWVSKSYCHFSPCQNKSPAAESMEGWSACLSPQPGVHGGSDLRAPWGRYGRESAGIWAMTCAVTQAQLSRR